MVIQEALTDQTFDNFVKENKFAVVHFWAIWNGNDVKMRRLIESEIPEEISDPIGFGTLAVDPEEHWDIARGHSVLTVPFLVFYRDGALVRSVAGLPSSAVINQYLVDLVGQVS